MGILIQVSGEDEGRVGGHQRACGLYVDGLSVEVDVSQLFKSEVVGESEVPRNRPSEISKVALRGEGEGCFGRPIRGGDFQRPLSFKGGSGHGEAVSSSPATG